MKPWVGLDISNLQFNDYFIVRNGELISSMQIPKEISSHDNPLWVWNRTFRKFVASISSKVLNIVCWPVFAWGQGPIHVWTAFPGYPKMPKASRLLKFTTLRRRWMTVVPTYGCQNVKPLISSRPWWEIPVHTNLVASQSAVWPPQPNSWFGHQSWEIEGELFQQLTALEVAKGKKTSVWLTV